MAADSGPPHRRLTVRARGDGRASRRLRRRELFALAAALALPGRARSQPSVHADPGVDARSLNTPEGTFRIILQGAPMQPGRVRLDLPAHAENGHSVAMTVSVDSPMTEADHVRRIDLVSDRNPVPHMATFFLGPWAGRAEVSSRIRLNGTQRMTAIAQLSDGSFWFTTADIVVDEAACLDGS